MCNRIKSTLVVILLGLIALNAECQSLPLPQVIPPSPQSAELIRRIDIPPANYTGIPGQEIHIFNIESKELRLPVSVTYNFSGLRPAEKNGILGLGWSLNAGGRITRSVRKSPDEQNYYLQITIQSSSLFSLLQNRIFDLFLNMGVDFSILVDCSL